MSTESQVDTTRPLVIYHAGCNDGFTSAWLVNRWFTGSADFFPGVHNLPPPNVVDRDVIMVDFSYKKEVIEGMRVVARSILILDHHKTAEEDLKDYIYLGEDPLNRPFVGLDKGDCFALFDMNQSGAGMVWNFFFHGLSMPGMVMHVQDYDLWRFEIDGSKEIVRWMYAQDQTFDNWDMMLRTVATDWSTAYDHGALLLQSDRKLHRDLIKEGRRRMKLGKGALIYSVDVVNAPWTMASEIGNILAKEKGIGGTYFDRADGKRVFSLRSVGDLDVSAIALQYGGGGHKNAAGFSMPHGWEGE